jgi:hypothetical protein
MARIDNPVQLRQLHLRYAQMEGANAAAQVAAQAAQGMAKQYLDALNMLTGLAPREGQRIEVDWESGEVSVSDQHEHSLNGVPA